MTSIESVSSAAGDFTSPVDEARLERVLEGLQNRGFVVEILDTAAQARERVPSIIPAGVSVLTASSETLRLSGIDNDINTSGRYDAIRPRVAAMDREKQRDLIRRAMAAPDWVVGSVSAVVESGSLVAVSASGSQLPSYAGGAGRLLLVVGAQKVVSDLGAAFRRVEDHALPLEIERARRIYGRASAANKILVMNREPFPPRTIVLLLREVIGF
jgi:hypothetical protein